MNTCLCGNVIPTGNMRCPRCAALYALDLETGASEAEIRRAYRLLVKVWHPDRFQSDPALKVAAEAKLKEINSAFEFLTSTSTERGPWRPPSPPAAEDASSPSQAQPPTAAPSPVATPDPVPHLRPWPVIRFALETVALLFTLLLGRYLWIAFDAPDPTSGDVARVYDKGKQTLLKSLDAPMTRFVDAVKHDLRRFDLRASAPAQPAIPQDAPSAPSASQPAAQQTTTISPPNRASTPPQKLLPYITIGSTKDEVLVQQGTPTASTDAKLTYGKSELYLKDGSVIGWRIDPASPIRVKLWPSTAVDPSLASYTVGSSKDVVLTVQGTPTAFSEDRFEYGKSIVIFRRNKVVSWKEDPGSTPLWAR